MVPVAWPESGLFESKTCEAGAVARVSKSIGLGAFATWKFLQIVEAGRFAGDGMLLTGPSAQIDQFASLATKRTERVGRIPEYRFPAFRAFDPVARILGIQNMHRVRRN